MRDLNLKYVGLLLLLSIIMFACDEKYDPQFERETTIDDLLIANGGFYGKTVYEGEYYADKNQFVFENVDAETDLQNIKFSGRIALGAAPEFPTYDFTNDKNPQTIKIINRENTREYSVYLEILPPKMDPVLDRVVILLEDGKTEVVGIVNNDTKILELDAKNGEAVFLLSSTALPKHAKIEFTTIDGDKLLADNPGKVILDHMGRITEYDVVFTYIPPAGADFSKKVIYDFTTARADANRFPNVTGGLVRGGDFDGTGALMPLQNQVKFLKLEDIINDNAAGAILAIPPAGDVNFGYFGTNNVGISNGNYYAMNMPGPGGNFFIRHWTDMSIPVDKVITIPVPSSEPARYGDNMSMQLDENGNGYVFSICNNVGRLFRATVTNYATIDSPTFMPIAIGGANAAAFVDFNPVLDHTQAVGVGSLNEYTVMSTSGVLLFDRDGNKDESATIGSTLLAAIGHYNARIFIYNNARYLAVLTNGTSTLTVYDITEGKTTAEAMRNFKINEKARVPILTHVLGAYAGMGSALSTGVNGDKLYIMASASDLGMVVIELPKKIDE